MTDPNRTDTDIRQPAPPPARSMDALLKAVRACTLCQDLPLGPRPVLQASAESRILIVGQAPGRRAHDKGLPFDDPSGDRLRRWLGLDRPRFYDPANLALVPMGFCFPGTGKGGDLPPRTACAPAWRAAVLGQMKTIGLILVLGRYAQDWHLGGRQRTSLTETVEAWSDYWPDVLPLPHPSPRNMGWFARNPWFEHEVVPVLQERVVQILGPASSLEHLDQGLSQ